MFQDMIIPSEAGTSVRTTVEYHEGYSTQKTLAKDKTYTVTLPEGAEPYEVWIGVSNVTISGTVFNGWGRLTKEQVEETGSNVTYRSYAGSDFNNRDWGVSAFFEDNTVVIKNTTTGSTTFSFKAIYVLYYI